MNVLSSDDMREPLDALVSAASIDRDRATGQKVPMTILMSLVIDREGWPDRGGWPNLEDWRDLGDWPYREGARYEGFDPRFPPFNELAALAFVSLVPLDWTPAAGAEETDFGHTSADGEEPAFGSIYTHKLEFRAAALLIPDEEDPVPRVLFELPEHTGSSVVSLTLMDRAITAITLFRQHCGTVSSGCLPKRSRCTCRAVPVRSRRDGTTWQCRCTRHQAP